MRQTGLTIQHFSVDLVVDVGANVGQFAVDLWSEGFAGRIVSIEPLRAAHASLLAAARGYPSWTVLPPCAVGEDERDVEMHVAGNSVSSSVLEMLDRHVEAAPGSAPLGVEMVHQTTLDALLLPQVRAARAAMIKIDTQGYERAVLAGAGGCLTSAVLVLLELSLQPLYRDQPLWMDMLADMKSRGFELWSMQPEFCDPKSGQLLQINGMFYRPSRAG